MSVLSYPPIIEGKIPAFVQGTKPGSTTIIVPFLLSRTVSRQDFNMISLKIVTVTGNRVQKTIDTSIINYNSQTNSYYATFVIHNTDTDYFTGNVGQYYKLQISFKNSITNNLGAVISTETSAWSSVGVIKCTAEPAVTLDSLDIHEDNINYTYFTGKYINNDKTERVYSYSFTIYDDKNEIYETSGTLIHNTAENDNIVNNCWESYDTWHTTKSLKDDVRYTIIYSVTTTNNYKKDSSPYKIKNAETVFTNLDAKLLAIPDYDNGCISLKLIKPKELQEEKPISGNFVINRYSENMKTWNEVCRFSLRSQFPSEIDTLWTDYTIEHGVRYQYALQMYNSNGLYSSKIYNVIANPDSFSSIPYLEKDEDGNPYYITADFEDAFLVDGNRQLKIRFNPQVSSFKPNILETKIETLGGKYPFIFRNGIVNYKEFSVGGLLSYLGDENELFISGVRPEAMALERKRTAAAGEVELGSSSNKFANIPTNGTALTSDNFYRERQFKMAALEWLTNGEPKLFRSPGEGNYIIRLMNVSLSPNDTIGRMIHSFSATAYEIAECNFENLQHYNLIHTPLADYRTMKFMQVKLANHSNPYQPHNMYGAFITNASSGTIYELTFDQVSTNNPVLIEIGTTETYYIDVDTPLASIKKISGDINNSAILNYGYYDSLVEDEFNLVSKITAKSEVSQFIGEGHHINLIDLISDSRRRRLEEIISISVEPRPVITVYSSGSKFYFDSKYKAEVTYNKMEQAIYYDANVKAYYSGYSNLVKRVNFVPDFTVTLYNPEEHFDYSIGNVTIYTDAAGNVNKEQERNTLTNPLLPTGKNPFESVVFGPYGITADLGILTSITAGSGVIVTISYRFKEVEYVIETTDETVSQKKHLWETARITWLNNTTANTFLAMQNAYKEYLLTLHTAIEEYEALGGLL